VDRAAKEALKTSLHDVFKDTGVVVVAHYTGMTVAQMTDYRRKVKAAGGSVKVAKNRIAKLALKDTDAAGIADLLRGPTVLATTLLNPANVKALADLPSLDQLRATLLSLFNTPATQLARTIKEPGAALARVIKAKADKVDAPAEAAAA
jgi:large subunit ribosomal protein L10